MEVKAQNEAFQGGTISFAPLSLQAHTVGCIVYLSRELAADAVNVAQAIETALAGSLAAFVDKLALTGSGNSQPRGIYHTTGVQSIVVNDALSHLHLLGAWSAIAQANGEPLTVALNPRDMAALSALSTDLGFLAPPSLVSQMQMLHSSVIPKNLGDSENESVGFVGDFRKLFIGVREDMAFEVHHYAGDTFKKHQVGIKVTMRLDVGIEHPSHFVRLLDIAAPTSIPTPGTTTPAPTTTAD